MTLDEAFTGLADPRTGPALRHNLREMILMALCSVLCGADTWVDVAEWAEDNESWLRRYLVLAHGTPSHDTFGRVFRVLDATVFEQSFRNWVSGLVGVIEGAVALDGKTVCGSRDGENTALHMVSAYATASGLCLGQEGTRGKGNEIAAIKALLDTLALKGCIVTIDAIGRQTEIAQQIVDRGGDYLLAVKDNQGKLADALREFFSDALSNLTVVLSFYFHLSHQTACISEPICRPVIPPKLNENRDTMIEAELVDFGGSQSRSPAIQSLQVAPHGGGGLHIMQYAYVE